MNPYDNVGTTRLSTSSARPALPAVGRLPGRRGRARHRGAAAPDCSRGRTGWSRTRSRSPGRPGCTRTSGRAPASAARSTPRWSPPKLSELRGVRPGRDDERLPAGRLRRDDRGAVRADPARRGGRDHPGAGAAADLGGPLPARPGMPPSRVEEKSRPTRRCAGAREGRAGPRRAAAPQAQAARARRRRSTQPGPRRRRWSSVDRSDRGRPTPRRPAAARHRAHRRAGRAGRGADRRGRSDPEVRAPGPADRGPARGAAAARGTRPARRGAGRARSACRTGAARTTSTWTARSRCSPSSRCPRRRTSSSGSGYAPARRSCSLVDVSGSMRGERIRTAAATVGALAGELRRDDLAVVAFWSDAAVLLRLGAPVPPAAAARRAARDPGPRADQRRLPAAGRRAASWPGSRPGTPGCCCCPTACTTPAPTRGRSRPGCRGWTCCSTPRRARPGAGPGAGRGRPRPAAAGPPPPGRGPGAEPGVRGLMP